jgi:multidrug transporter EmrE-like cation transporter
LHAHAAVEVAQVKEFMYQDNREQQSDGIVTLLKETADRFGHLISVHLKLTRLELLADIKAYGQRVAILAAFIPFVFLGYALVCLGLAVELSRWLGLGGALFLVGGVHLFGAAAATLLAIRKLQGMHLMHESTHEANESVSSLTSRITNGKAPVAAAPERVAIDARSVIAKAGRGSHIVDSQR